MRSRSSHNVVRCMLIVFAVTCTHLIATIDAAHEWQQKHRPLKRASPPVSENNFKCTVFSDTNVSHAEAASFATPKFTVSAEDCCAYCSSVVGCVAGVWYRYYCHVFNGSVPFGPLVHTTGVTYIANADWTTTTTTTAAPTTTTTTTTTTTQAPTPPPPTTTVSPAILPPSTMVIRFVYCGPSGSNCSRWNDSSCTTTAFYNNSCNGNTSVVCEEDGTEISVELYKDEGCPGTPFQQNIEVSGVCYQNPSNYSYQGQYCDWYGTYPVLNVPITRTTCPDGCMTGGSECQVVKANTGVCTSNTLPTLLNGQSMIAWCYPTYIVFLSYAALDCSGFFLTSYSEPVGTQCFLDMNENHIQTLCEG